MSIIKYVATIAQKVIDVKNAITANSVLLDEVKTAITTDSGSLTDVKTATEASKLLLDDLKTIDTANGVLLNDIKTIDTANGVLLNDIKTTETANGVLLNDIKTALGTSTITYNNIITAKTAAETSADIQLTKSAYALTALGLAGAETVKLQVKDTVTGAYFTYVTLTAAAPVANIPNLPVTARIDKDVTAASVGVILSYR